jgi:hypothetical protein
MRRLVLLVAALAAAACDQPPVKEIGAAEQQVERARAAGAPLYAAERMKQAETALAAARQHVNERHYRSALSAATDAAESARVAIELTKPAKAAAQKEAEIAVGEVRTMLDRATAERAEALKAGVPRGTLAALDARVERGNLQLAAASDRLGLNDLDYAQRMTSLLRTEVTPLADLYRGARTQWEAKHPKGRPRPPARRPAR